MLKIVFSLVQQCSSSPINFLLGSADKVVFPVPESPKNIAVSSSSRILAEQCIGKAFFNTGSIKFKDEKTPFLISPVYPLPPIKMIFLLKLRMVKLPCLVPSTSGLASKPGALTMIQSSSKFSSSDASGLKNILKANKLHQGCSFTDRILSR